MNEFCTEVQHIYTRNGCLSYGHTYSAAAAAWTVSAFVILLAINISFIQQQMIITMDNAKTLPLYLKEAAASG